jgi:hypothetical protein
MYVTLKYVVVKIGDMLLCLLLCDTVAEKTIERERDERKDWQRELNWKICLDKRRKGRESLMFAVTDT